MARTDENIETINDEIGDGIKLSEVDKYSTINARVAELIMNTRTKAGLSQKKLAQKINTTQSVISRLENANYEGHSLSMLSRIAQAMEKEVNIDFVPTSTSQRN